MYVKFSDDLEPHKSDIKIISDNVVQLIPENGISINTSGFRTYMDYEMTRLLGDYSDYTTAYNNRFCLSNDGSTETHYERIEAPSAEFVQTTGMDELNGRMTVIEECILEMSLILGGAE